MTTTDLSLVLDPGGIPGVRPGINLQVFPASDPISLEWGGTVSRLGNSNLSSAGIEERYEFTTKFFLKGLDFYKFRSLLAFNEQAKVNGDPFEIVIYNLYEPYSEISPVRTRFIVPGTSPIEEEPMGSTIRWTYWVALQGHIQANTALKGNFQEIEMTFTEGTKLTAAMET